MKTKPIMFVISGKSPKADSGGYPAYAYSLSNMIGELGYRVITLGIGEKESVQKDNFGEIRILNSGPLKYIPVLKHLALAGLPYYSILFYQEIKKLCTKNNIKSFSLWGMGPWAFVAFFLKIFPPKNVKMKLITSYFTSTRHEMEGAYKAINIKDYGYFPKIRYFLVYEVVARIFHIFEKLTLDHCDIVVTHYKSSNKIIKKHFSIFGKKVVTFPWFTEVFKRTGKSITNKDNFYHPTIVSISRQDPRKGINYLLRAMKIVNREYPKAKGMIVGTGSFLELNRKLNKKLGLENVVQIPGFVSDIEPILKQADIIVIIPLRQGSSSLTVFEAMSYGKAIVASNVDGIPEDLENNKSAVIVRSANEKETAKAILKILKNKLFRNKLEKNCKQRFNGRFNYKSTKNYVGKLLNQEIIN